jgi:hypothetical protein
MVNHGELVIVHDIDFPNDRKMRAPQNGIFVP